MNFKQTFSFLILLLAVASPNFAQSTVDVVIGTNNVPITAVRLKHGSSPAVTQSQGATTVISTTTPVLLEHFQIGTNTELKPYNKGLVVRNNNFNTTSIQGVGVYREGANTLANDKTAFEAALVNMVNNNDLLNFVYYDFVNNTTPSGDDFDIIFAKGFKSGDHVAIGERNGNTFFTITPLDENGNVITTAKKIRFGSAAGSSTNGNTLYDWNIGYAPGGGVSGAGQPMMFTIIQASLFGIGANDAIYGFRIDNTGEADVKFFGLNENGYDNNPRNSKVGGITGNVFNDANGLVNNTVDGAGIDKIGTTQLYANLYNPTTNQVIASTPVSSGDANGNGKGQYEFLTLKAGTYAVSISTTAGTVGSTVPNPTLPSDWINTGEHNNTTAGNDGTVDGKQIAVTVINDQTLTQNINFGIQKKPTATPRTHTIDPPGANTDFVIGSGVTDNLAGDDNEDGTLGTGKNFGITSLPTSNNGLEYNGTPITTGQDGTNPPSPTNPFMITNYDPSLLKLKFTGDANQTSTSFNYIAYDAANTSSAPATYTLSYSALPVEWLYFDVKICEKQACLQFATAQETNTSHFDIQKSKDGRNFETIGKIEAAGHSAEVREYSFVDENLAIGYNYYRILQHDLDELFSFSEVRVISNGVKHSLNVYPNPISTTKGLLNITFHSSKGKDIIRLSNLLGDEIMKKEVNSEKGMNHHILDISSLPNGTYILSINESTGSEIIQILN